MTLLRLFAAGIFLLITLAWAAMPNGPQERAHGAYQLVDRLEQQLDNVVAAKDGDHFLQETWLPAQQSIERELQASNPAAPLAYPGCYGALVAFQHYADDRFSNTLRDITAQPSSRQAYLRAKQDCKREITRA
ncbi:hypothetical protein [Chitinolyticbacter meiyuanensis]|uniref:hypothetical protein n=1 Tax=Chitinolyticbacter meiyuanensis TaxID=682798 RepID=UPI0011E5EB92|nr:hypothetical protein [Chitinolyticbacter meiyuanensis]